MGFPRFYYHNMVKPLVCCGLVLLSQSRGALGFSLQTPPPSAPTTTSASATPAQTSAGVRINSAEITQNGETVDVGFSVSGAGSCPRTRAPSPWTLIPDQG